MIERISCPGLAQPQGGAEDQEGFPGVMAPIKRCLEITPRQRCLSIHFLAFLQRAFAALEAAFRRCAFVIVSDRGFPPTGPPRRPISVIKAEI